MVASKACTPLSMCGKTHLAVLGHELDGLHEALGLVDVAPDALQQHRNTSFLPFGKSLTPSICGHKVGSAVDAANDGRSSTAHSVRQAPKQVDALVRKPLICLGEATQCSGQTYHGHARHDIACRLGSGRDPSLHLSRVTVPMLHSRGGSSQQGAAHQVVHRDLLDDALGVDDEQPPQVHPQPLDQHAVPRRYFLGAARACSQSALAVGLVINSPHKVHPQLFNQHVAPRR